MCRLAIERDQLKLYDQPQMPSVPGCGEVQGDYVSRPLPLDDITDRLRKIASHVLQ